MAEENSEDIHLPPYITEQLRIALDELLIQKNNGILSSASMAAFTALRDVIDPTSDQPAH